MPAAAPSTPAASRCRRRRVRRLPGVRQRCCWARSAARSGTGLPGALRPEKALLGLRSGARAFIRTCARPSSTRPLAGACPLRPEIVAKGFDLMMVRELTGGIYFGERGRRDGKYGARGLRYRMLQRHGDRAHRPGRPSTPARKRRKQRHSASTRPTCWNPPASGARRVHRVAADYPDVELHGHAGGQRRHAAGAQPGPVRRGGHRQHVRRHPLRRGVA